MICFAFTLRPFWALSNKMSYLNCTDSINGICVGIFSILYCMAFWFRLSRRYNRLPTSATFGSVEPSQSETRWRQKHIFDTLLEEIFAGIFQVWGLLEQIKPHKIIIDRTPSKLRGTFLSQKCQILKFNPNVLLLLFLMQNFTRNPNF